MLAILVRKKLEQRGAAEAEFRKIDRDIFDLVQERELDRVGVAAERSIVRRTNPQTVRNYQQALSELCAARSTFDSSVKSAPAELPYSRLPGSVPGGRVLIKVADLSALLDATREVSAGHHHYVRV